MDHFAGLDVVDTPNAGKFSLVARYGEKELATTIPVSPQQVAALAVNASN